MEYNLDKKLMPSQISVLDSVMEQPVDVDFTLPDYCPDIEKILKCSLQTKIFSRSFSGNQLQIDGNAVVKVLYIDSINKHIRSTEQTVPFSTSFTINVSSETYVVNTTTKTEYLNCRALSPRRLAIHGAFSLYANVEEKSGTELAQTNDEALLETDTSLIKTAELIALSQDQFTVNEEITVSNKPNIEVLLRDSVKATVTSIKIIPDKVIIKGDLNLKVLYIADISTGEIEQIDYLLPFNQILDAPGINEDASYDLQVSILSYDIRLKSDPTNESPVLILDVKMVSSIAGYQPQEQTVINDVYSTQFATEIIKENVPVITDVNKISEALIEKTDIELENSEIEKIIDIYNEFTTVNYIINDNSVTFNGKYNICILAYDSESSPIYFEKSIDFEYTAEQEKEINAIKNINADISSISYRLQDDKTIELRTEITIEASAITKNSYVVVSEVIANEEKVIEKRKCALTLYYASKDEKLWDIAKRYNTKVEMIKDENFLESKKLENSQMLLITTV